MRHSRTNDLDEKQELEGREKKTGEQRGVSRLKGRGACERDGVVAAEAKKWLTRKNSEECPIGSVLALVRRGREKGTGRGWKGKS